MVWTKEILTFLDLLILIYLYIWVGDYESEQRIPRKMFE